MTDTCPNCGHHIENPKTKVPVFELHDMNQDWLNVTQLTYLRLEHDGSVPESLLVIREVANPPPTDIVVRMPYLPAHDDAPLKVKEESE